MEPQGTWERLAPVTGIVFIALILGAGFAFAVTSGGAATAEFCQAHPKWAQRHPNKCPTTTTTTSTSSSTTTSTTTTTPGGCALSASPSNFTTQLNAAAAGQTVCLATGNYGTFQGTSKILTIKAAPGASPSMTYNLGSGDSGFTLDGLANTGGTVNAGAHDITIRNSTFTDYARFNSGPTPNFVLDQDRFVNFNSPAGAPNSRIGIYYGGVADSGVTVKNSLLQGGDSDGVHTGAGVHVLNNEFSNLCDAGGNHTDNFQAEGAPNVVIRGNYVHVSAGCTTQGITSYDDPSAGADIEDNVIDIHRAWGIEWYSDQDSTIRHNTVVYHPPGCYFNLSCGQIALDRKSTQPAGTGTLVYDNVADVSLSDGSTAARNDHNVSGSRVTYAGGASPTTYLGFHLAPGSVGKGAASDGGDVGIR